MKQFTRQLKNQEGFTLVEVLISMLILSIIITSLCVAFSYSVKVSRDNQYNMTSINLANETLEYIRSLQFVDVGTVGGDPPGVLQQSRLENVDGTDYKITTFINWEEEGDWETLGNAEWDYKSVRISAVPEEMEGNEALTKTIESYVTRDSTQPPVTGGSIRIRVIRGWKTTPGTKTPVANVKVKLTAGPSAPRQILTTYKGAARFINLSPGTYTEYVDPSSLGMILLPGLTDWNRTLSNYVTLTEEYDVEYPCSLRISLKDIYGSPISLASGENGNLSLQVPYGTNSMKNFSSAQLDSQGKLPADFITGLWPVGLGYAGAYAITNISIPKYVYLGSYEGDGAGTPLWDGTFMGPGTTKDITCKFLPFPVTPAGITTGWVSGTDIITTPTSNYAYDSHSNIVAGKFESANLTNMLNMPGSKTVHFNAASMYFENTGDASNPGLYINNRANLYLHTGLIVFRGKVTFRTATYTTYIGKIILSTVYQNGASALSYDGSLIGGSPGVKYGKVFFTQPVVLGSTTKVEPGGYYFYNGLTLPNNAADLIPITSENYID